MSIQQKINSLKPYVKAMRFYKDFPVIDAVFKKGWKVPEGKVIKFVKDEESGVYTFLCENKNVGFDELLEYIEQIINFNIDLEKKQELFKAKSKELQEIFLSSDNKFEDLVNLEFVINTDNSEEELNLFDGKINDEQIIKKEVITKKVNKEEKKETKTVEQNKVIEEKKPINRKKETKNIVEEFDDIPLAKTDQPKYKI